MPLCSTRFVHHFVGALGASALLFSCGTDSATPGTAPITVDPTGSGGSGGTVGNSGAGGVAGAGQAGDAEGAGSGGQPTGGAAGTLLPMDAAADTKMVAVDGSVPASSDAAAFEGGSAVAGCDKNNYAACMDFETGKDPKWTGLGANVVTGHPAHGMYSFHGPPNSLVTTTQLGSITNVIWGRFYLHMSPGSPYGHGELVGAYDQAGNWYEVGFEFKGLQGNWHFPGGEKYMRSHPDIPDKWICVEFLFDGATPAVAQIWMDSQPVDFYDVSKLAGPTKVTKFTKVEIGFNRYHGLSLTTIDGDGPPAMKDMWVDDIALDTKRIGCIQ